ncbi:MAG: CPBP family intramembrane metalloprotease [Planctomycetes bacterium]|nr:CPBP family intramembrane metalloprotease [Planctomycetota bacterium]
MSDPPAIRHMPWWPIVLAAAAPTLATVLYLHAADSTSIVQILYFASKAIIFSFPAAWWLIVERRARAVSFSSRGSTDGENVAQCEYPRELPTGRDFIPLAARGDIALGVGSGALIGASLWCMYLVMFRGVIDADVLAERVRQFGMYEHFLLYMMFLAIINSGLEEYYWRWFVFGRLRAKIGASAAVVLSSLAFAAHHFVALHEFLGSAWLAGLFSVGIAIGGAVWACLYHHTGRLWGVWASHCVVDVAALSIGYSILFHQVHR